MLQTVLLPAIKDHRKKHAGSAQNKQGIPWELHITHLIMCFAVACFPPDHVSWINKLASLRIIRDHLENICEEAGVGIHLAQDFSARVILLDLRR